jgi:hypothetical protein
VAAGWLEILVCFCSSCPLSLDRSGIPRCHSCLFLANAFSCSTFLSADLSIIPVYHFRSWSSCHLFTNHSPDVYICWQSFTNSALAFSPRFWIIPTGMLSILFAFSISSPLLLVVQFFSLSRLRPSSHKKKMLTTTPTPADARVVQFIYNSGKTVTVLQKW